MSGRIIIVHFNPIEKYPPFSNLLHYISGHNSSDLAIKVFTTSAGKDATIKMPGNIEICSLRFNENANRLTRLWVYFRFNFNALKSMIRLRPATIAYFETISAGAPVFFKKFIHRKARILIHYHEYSTPAEYDSGMALVKYFHHFEKSVYKQAAWVSHTNQNRLDFFLQDLGLPKRENFKVFPNYPPAEWAAIVKTVSRNPGKMIRLVYVGALSIQTTHVVEIVNFVTQHNGKFCLDIYSDNITSETLEFLKSVPAQAIHLRGAVPYARLPYILPEYDVGLILYRATTINFQYNVPNKFFEYSVCGLNIVYAKEMKSLHAYDAPSGNPWVRRTDFNKLSASSFEDVLEGPPKAIPTYACETEIAKFYTDLLNTSN